jgi:3-hydroxybutyryl-CoA dehydrogenase
MIFLFIFEVLNEEVKDMNVFAIGSGKQIEELGGKISDLTIVEDSSEIMSNLSEGDLVIHFWEDESMDDLSALLQKKGVNILLNSLNTTLREIRIFNPTIEAKLFGFAGIPGFINRDVWEISSTNNEGLAELNQILSDFGVEGISVNDRVGMITPRVVAMIINEAYYTVMEGTAKKEDINIAMQLGTNYPGGPFEWVQNIGIDHIYELLDALYEDTKEERYKICPLLKQEYIEFLNS